VSSQTRRTRTTKKGASQLSDDESACMIVFNMSSGSYSGLAMQDPVHRNLKESIIAPKTASSGNAEQYVMPSNVDQLNGLPKSSEVVRNVESIAWRREA
jgi:hypothetical protein